jgi:hypothetical protein
VAVALLVVLHRPDQARRMVLVAGVFHRDGWHPETTGVDPFVTSTLDCWHPAAWDARMHRKVTAAAQRVTGGWQMITPFDYDRDPERFRLEARVTQQHPLMAHSLYDQLA